MQTADHARRSDRLVLCVLPSLQSLIDTLICIEPPGHVTSREDSRYGRLAEFVDENAIAAADACCCCKLRFGYGSDADDNDISIETLSIRAHGCYTFVLFLKSAGRRFQTNIHALLIVKAPEKIRSEEHTSELQSLMRTSYAVFCLKKKKTRT